jgi:hypothetical protein
MQGRFAGKGEEYNLCEAPFGPLRQIALLPIFVRRSKREMFQLEGYDPWPGIDSAI